MDMYTATEISFKNGYAHGYENAKKKFYKTGEWYNVETLDNGTLSGVCSTCHLLSHISPSASYCPYCGSKNR